MWYTTIIIDTDAGNETFKLLSDSSLPAKYKDATWIPLSDGTEGIRPDFPEWKDYEFHLVKDDTIPQPENSYLYNWVAKGMMIL